MPHNRHTATLIAKVLVIYAPSVRRPPDSTPISNVPRSTSPEPRGRVKHPTGILRIRYFDDLHNAPPNRIRNALRRSRTQAVRDWPIGIESISPDTAGINSERKVLRPLLLPPWTAQRKAYGDLRLHQKHDHLLWK